MDYVVRALTKSGNIRAFAATTRSMVNEAAKIHNTTPVVSAALGRTLTAASIMGTMMKNKTDIMTIQIQCDGEIKGILATSNYEGNVKGYAYNSEINLPLKPDGKLDVGRAVGKGRLTVIKDVGMKEPYVGQVSLVSGEIAEDITYYFAKSEQTPTAVALGVLVDIDYTIKQAGGLIVQIMPGATEEEINTIEQKIEQLPQITTLLERGDTPEDILYSVLGDTDILEKREVFYKCDCSEQRVEKALISIGKDELQEILNTDKKAVLHCHFCNKDYEFDENKLLHLLTAK